jgi:localization factor PodJL
MDQTFDEIRQLAEQGLTGCQIELGNGYLTGATVGGRKLPQDFAEAKRWLEPAHGKGASTATFILGTMYEEGKGVPVDLARAIEYYESAAAQGAYLPCVRLARIYARGNRLSPERAAEWYRKVLTFDGQVDDQGEMDEARNFLQRA